MRWFVEMLRRLGILPRYSSNEVLNASIEDTARDHELLVSKVAEASQRREVANKHLRQSIDKALMQTTALGQFEQRIRKRRNVL